MKVVITGPTGAIGMALIQQCIQQNIEVLAICHKKSSRISQIPQNPLVSVWELDLDEYASQVYEEKPFLDLGAPATESAVPKLSVVMEPLREKKFDIFIHLAWSGTTGAARNDTRLQVRNQKHALDAVRLAKALGCHTFIGAGSQAEYGRFEGKLTAQTPTFPENGYGIAKLAAGQLTRILCKQMEMKHIWLRILSVYGPHDGNGSMIMSTLCKLMKGERASFTKGEQMWDYLYSEDAARAILALAEKGVDGKVYPLGGGSARPLREYIEVIADTVQNYVGQNGPIKYSTVLGDGRKVQYDITDIKELLEIGAVPYADKQVMHLEADISELKNDTGFEPLTAFEEGMKKTLDFYLRQNSR